MLLIARVAIHPSSLILHPFAIEAEPPKRHFQAKPRNEVDEVVPS
jgi:hypothetical protein